MKSLYRFNGAIPYLIAVFLNASIDLGHKIILQNSLFKLYDGSQQIFLTAIVNGLILLPFILLMSPAGFLSDRFPKHLVLRNSAWAALGLTSLVTLFYALGWFWLAFTTTFVLAAQSAIFSPAKYSYLKLLFGKSRLAEANGLMQSVSIVAILAGTFLYSILFEIVFPSGATAPNEVIRAMVPAGLALMTASAAEVWLSYRIPALDTESKSKQFVVKDYLLGKDSREALSVFTQRKNMRLAILGLSMFWGLGQVLLASFPAYAKEVIGITNTILIQGTLACTGIGIAFGSATAGRISKGYIETGLIPLGALGITLGLWLVPSISSVVGEILCFLLIGFFGGFFIVPLYALIQFYANDDEIGQVIAVNNWVQNVVMLSLLVLVSAAAWLSISAQGILYAAAVFAVFGSLLTVSRLPQSLVRFLLSGLIQRRYSVRVNGMKNIPEEGGVLLLGNHVSWMDWAIVQIACPRPIHFVMAKSLYEKWYLTRILKFFGCIPIASGNSSQQSLEQVAGLLNRGKVVCLFPEGTLSRTGHLVEFKRGFERACQLANTEVQIVPFYLRGLWGSQLSYAQGTLKKTATSGLRREIIVGFGKPLPSSINAAKLKQKIFDLSTQTWKSYSENLPTLTEACLRGLRRAGSRTLTIDAEGKEYSGTKLLAGASLFASHMNTDKADRVGLLLPMTPAAVITNIAALLNGKIPVNLNYTSSLDALKSAVDSAEIGRIYTSKAFLQKLSQRGMDLTALGEAAEVIMLEDLANSFGKAKLLLHFLAAHFLPLPWFQWRYGRAPAEKSTATILFSSGSEGKPKGIELSHTNIMANIQQIAEVLDPQSDEVVMASLPPFHALGLTVTLFMPVTEGIKFICQPDPTNARSTAKLISKHKATMLFGSSSFLRLYTQDKSIDPLLLGSLRTVVAGAEKLKETVARDFRLKFGLEILEGYGATETSPVASVNIPDQINIEQTRIQVGKRAGSVGMPLPGTSFKIVDPETWGELDSEQEGMVLISGPQVMSGYLNDPDKTEQVIRIEDELRWYVTGDKGRIDADGFLWIVDRYSRIAKIGGEMISLSLVESSAFSALTTLAPEEEVDLMAMAVTDERKGEIVVLLATKELVISELKKQMLAEGASPVMLPERLVHVDELPKLGSGKPDYKTAGALAETKQ